MFLKLGKEDFTWPRAKKALPVFFLLWTGGALLALIYLLVLRSHLEGIERGETDRLLDGYLASHRTPVLHSGSLLLRSDSLLQGLAFIRVIQGTEQLLVVGDQLPAQSFKGFIDLSPETSGVWVPVGMGGETRMLTIVTRRYENGGMLQAGKDGQQGYALFQKMWLNTLAIVVLSVLFIWPLSLAFIRQSLAPLLKSREMIDNLVQQPTSALLPEEGNGQELDSLYKQINRLIIQNRRLVAEMQQSLDNVAHDLRTPMTRLRSVAEYGLQAEDDPQRLREALSDCLEESERVLAMLRIMMSVAEAESGMMRLELGECDLVDSLAQVVTLYEYVAEERKIAVELSTEKPLPARVDATRIAQVWANLLDNAIKYGKEGGWVKISGRRAGDEVEVVFSDNGMGISENEQGRIWERLYRGDRSRSQKGLGLGLNYVRAVVEAHGGSVAVTSALREGSSFSVHLPCAQVNIQEKSQTSGEWSDRRTSGM
ncbi:MAG: HAMP domain-containing histidine kinase [Desulforhopalus sp.]|nr:HAMP domain-containing histidine kinase [Desulforhopalus sp.]